jgi:mRNA interferase RelE/StbE
VKYQIKVDKRASKAIAKLPKKAKRQIVERIDDLAKDPFPQDCVPIGSVKRNDVYRIRSGNYRIAYQVKEDVILILVLRIGHRKDFYEYFERL